MFTKTQKTETSIDFKSACEQLARAIEETHGNTGSEKSAEFVRRWAFGVVPNALNFRLNGERGLNALIDAKMVTLNEQMTVARSHEGVEGSAPAEASNNQLAADMDFIETLQAQAEVIGSMLEISAQVYKDGTGEEWVAYRKDRKTTGRQAPVGDVSKRWQKLAKHRKGGTKKVA